MVQAVSNLLHNAIKFTDRGGQVHISVGADERNHGSVRVKDSGTGISSESLPSVFEPFMQSKETIGRSQGGLGLGLALTRGLVELQGGTVSAHSDGPGLGSVFTIEMPRISITGKSDPDVPSVANAESLHSRRILIVEDLHDAAATLQLLLQMMGHTVAVAHDGKAGLEKANSFNPEIILCDIGLPGDLDGYEVARTLRSSLPLRRLHLVAMTGFGTQDDKDKAERAGFDTHLTKPVDPSILESLIAQIPKRG